MRLACGLTSATDTHSEYVTGLSTGMMVMRTRFSVTKATNTRSEYVTVFFLRE